MTTMTLSLESCAGPLGDIEDSRDECARLLRWAADRIEKIPNGGSMQLRDVNGNKVGLIFYTFDAPTTEG